VSRSPLSSDYGVLDHIVNRKATYDTFSPRLRVITGHSSRAGAI
jgi:hypothetical protein